MKPFKIFSWGFLFLMLDFRIQGILGIDVLPDFIGFILFYMGLGGLRRKNIHFATARQYALPLIFLSFFDIYHAWQPRFNIDLFGGVFLVIGLITTILNLIMVYNLCTGIAKMARDQGNLRLMKNALAGWRYYLLANLLIMLSFFTIAIPPLAVVVFLVLVVALVVVLIMMMMLMKQADEELSIKDLS